MSWSEALGRLPPLLASHVLLASAALLLGLAIALPAGVLAGIAALVASLPLITDRMTDLSANAIAETRSVLIAPGGPVR